MKRNLSDLSLMGQDKKMSVYVKCALIPFALFVLIFSPIRAVKIMAAVFLVLDVLDIFRNRRKKTAMANCGITFSEDGISITLPNKEQLIAWENICEAYTSYYVGSYFALIPLKNTISLKERTKMRDRFHLELKTLGYVLDRVILDDTIRICGDYFDADSDWKELQNLLKEKTQVIIDK